MADKGLKRATKQLGLVYQKVMGDDMKDEHRAGGDVNGLEMRKCL